VSAEPLVRISGLTKTFRTPGGRLVAVDRVDLEIEEGRTLALVGESGSGKSTLGRCLLRLVEPDQGEVVVGGRRLLELGRRELRRFRRNAQMVFQDPFGSLNPRMRVRDILAEPLLLHTDLSRQARSAPVAEALRRVHLDPSYERRFPSELSGGEQQRVAIARAVITNPKLVVLDEPTSALDARVRKGIYELLVELQAELGLTYLLISHDLSSVWGVSDRVAVMYLGRIVEFGPKESIFIEPGHPYTVALMSAVPRITPPEVERTKRLVLEGEISAAGGEGCTFFSRCPLGVQSCTEERPELMQVSGTHRAACFRLEDVPEKLGGYRSFRPKPEEVSK
jgi:oligopeptide/dipeptide ABC transporter ATP-binding protein